MTPALYFCIISTITLCWKKLMHASGVGTGGAGGATASPII